MIAVGTTERDFNDRTGWLRLTGEFARCNAEGRRMPCVEPVKQGLASRHSLGIDPRVEDPVLPRLRAARWPYRCADWCVLGHIRGGRKATFGTDAIRQGDGRRSVGEKDPSGVVSRRGDSWDSPGGRRKSLMAEIAIPALVRPMEVM